MILDLELLIALIDICLWKLLKMGMEKNATIIASQLSTETWCQVAVGQVIVNAILDKIAHSPHRINLKGESMRGKLRKNTNFNIQIESSLILDLHCSVSSGMSGSI